MMQSGFACFTPNPKPIGMVLAYEYAIRTYQYARIQYARIRTMFQIETDGKASRNKKNKTPKGARAKHARPFWFATEGGDLFFLFLLAFP